LAKQTFQSLRINNKYFSHCYIARRLEKGKNGNLCMVA
jgi:hypothetical protein